MNTPPRGRGRPRKNPIKEADMAGDKELDDFGEQEDAELDAKALEAPPRREMRPPTRPETSRESAERRAREILESMSDADIAATDEFRAPAPPDGWTYEWKRNTVYNQEDPAYQVSLKQMGWEAVPRSRHPEMMPIGWPGEIIERKGMVLMQRPAIITDRIKQRDNQRARQQVMTKEEQLHHSGKGEFERKTVDGRSAVTVNKTYAPIPVPE